ncbi:MAG: signal peptide peptidase SppA [Candidatus Diapherotrites archaeon]|nr:signal peptide peptidase SppA [Candidatus Diapherotrites archaeon]
MSVTKPANLSNWPAKTAQNSGLFWPTLVVAGLLGLMVLFVLIVLAFAALGNTASFGNTIQMIPVKGEIGSTASAGNFSADELVDEIQKADEDVHIRAIVLDIDSPGGTIVSTKQVVAQIRDTKKPIVSYIGEEGASGAYYAAAATDYIVADEDSITASIGVISLFPDVNGLLDKLGIKMNILTEGKNKAIGNPFEDLKPEHRAMLQQLLFDAFSHFKRDIREFRGDKLDPARFEQIADGRVLSGTQALAAGLVDELGTKKRAIQKAADLAGIQGEPQIEKAEKKIPPLLDLFSNAGYSFGSGFRESIAAATSAPSIRASNQ